MNAVEFQGVSKTYGHRPVLDGVDFAVTPETFAVFIGPPGCGKSVLLRLLTGLEQPSNGKILLRGADVTRISAAERNIGYVPQSFALYPHYRVYDNIAYPLKLAGASKQETDAVVQRVAHMLRIDHLLKKKPNQLSGGEKQRVALARGIAKKTDTYVLDDPLSGLDFKLREQLFDDLRELREELRATFIYTTSDPLETLILAERVYVLDAGHVIESGSPEELYAGPMQDRTMALLGFPRTNVLRGRLERRAQGIWCATPLFEIPVELSSTASEGEEVVVAIRPEHLQVSPAHANGNLARFAAHVVLQEDLGGELVIYLDAGGQQLISVVRHDDAHLPAESSVEMAVSRPSIILYGAQEGRRLGQGAA